MGDAWQSYQKLQESLNKVNLINASLQFELKNGNCVEGLLGDFVFDRDNLFLELKDASINTDKFKDHILMGVDIEQWRIVQLAPSNAGNQVPRQSTFARATFPSTRMTASSAPNGSSFDSNSSKILIDQSVLNSMTVSTEKKKRNNEYKSELLFRYKEIDLSKDDDCIIIDLSSLQLPASNEIELIQRKSVHSSEGLQAYFDHCATVVTKLKSEAMIGFAILPQSDENLLNAYNNTVEYVQQLNRPLFMQNVLASMQYTYFCFSTAEMNYAFFFANLTDEDELINRKVFEAIMKPLFESKETQKIVNGCALMSGILWHKYRITLANVCDLQLVDRQIQKINIFHRKRPYTKYAPPPNVNQLRTYFAMTAEYLNIALTPPEAVTNWTNYTTKVGNVIRISLIFLRELSARMNYELLHYMFAFSNRALISLRSASDKEVDVLTTHFTQDEYYKQILQQPMFDAEKGIHFALNLNNVFPLRFYDPNLFIGEK